MGRAPQLQKYSVTYPQCDLDKAQAGKALAALEGARCVVVAAEHHKDGEPHLHAYVEFDKRKRRQTDLFDIEGHHGNIEMCKDVRGWMKYITKEDGDPFQWNFDVKACLQKRSCRLTVKRAAAMKYEELRTAVRPDQLQKTLAGIHLDRLMTAKVTDLDGPCGIWLTGPAGVGKSHDVRQFCAEAGLGLYEKAHNKWWDGYDGEQVVLLDDAHVDDRGWLARFLKLWADAYAFKAETKGGMISIRPRHFVVTSNYGPDEFAQHEEDRAAIMRRFKFHFVTKFGEALGALRGDVGEAREPEPEQEPHTPSEAAEPPRPKRGPSVWQALGVGPERAPVMPSVWDDEAEEDCEDFFDDALDEEETMDEGTEGDSLEEGAEAEESAPE